MTEGLLAFESKDYLKATRLLLSPAEDGDEVAQFVMAIMYLDGLGVEKNRVAGIRMARRCANQGKPACQYILGRAYVEGNGVPQNYVISHMWFNLAATNARDESERKGYSQKREALTRAMTASQLEEAQKLASDWKPLKETQPRAYP
ncbi:tetratricopeptide repeat protein [Rhodomicrobium sp.]|uniref:tetratricopeptide repeat protein n=1 Tax=Rhodomicrobium sp. TaxID=2720632 RepID=UPI0039E5FD47